MDALFAEERSGTGPVLPTLSEGLTDGENLLSTDVLKVEDFDQAWQVLEDYLGLTLQRMHANPGDPVPIAWTADHSERVAEKHARDFALFGYEIPDAQRLSGRALHDLAGSDDLEHHA